MTKIFDPFSIKSLPKWSPFRFLPTLRFRQEEIRARLNFTNYMLPENGLPDIDRHEIMLEIENDPTVAGDTAVNSEQRAILLKALYLTEHLGEPMCEIGAFRGHTSAFLASRTKRQYLVIDPYIGYGAWEEDMEIMVNRTRNLSNYRHIRLTSGAAAKELRTISFCFVDAVHDYANTIFDGFTYGDKVVKGGVIAFHDTDNPKFSGTRRAVFEIAKSHLGFEILFHAQDIVVLRKV
jgi:hypothetical protein